MGTSFRRRRAYEKWHKKPAIRGPSLSTSPFVFGEGMVEVVWLSQELQTLGVLLYP
jgi:hypothetical protein